MSGKRLLQHAVDEAVRLAGADGAFAYLRTDTPRELRLASHVGLRGARERSLMRGLRLQVGEGLVGTAVAESRVLISNDYAGDRSFAHGASPDRIVNEMGIRSAMAAPLSVGRRTIGGVVVFSRRAAAFSDRDAAIMRTLAEHAASAIRNADLIRELGASRRQLAQRIDVEQALREIAGRLTQLRKPAEVLQRTVDAAASLLGADGARIDLLDDRDGALYWGYDAATGRRPGLGPIDGDGEAEPGEGISGRAVTLRSPVLTGDYLADDRFRHAPAPDGFASEHSIRSALAAPILSEPGVLGTLTVYTSEVDAYGQHDAQLLTVLADQASIAITNARLIEDLKRSREEVAKRADVERALREITAEISAVRDPQEVLHRIAAEGARLLGTDRVFINLLNDPTGATGWTWYSPTETGLDPWPADDAIRLGEGVTGKAVAERRVFYTGDYLNDQRFIHRAGPDRYTQEQQLPSVIAVPIFDGETPLGAQMAESQIPDRFDDAEAERLEVLARQAGIALSNAHLLQRVRASESLLRESEARYRYLVTASPDVVWEVDTEGRFTFLSDAIEGLTGWAPGEVVGKRFLELVAHQTLPEAIAQARDLLGDPRRVTSARFSLRHRDGRAIPIENFATGLFRDGVHVGGHGAARDVSERTRLERDLRRHGEELATTAERAHLARELHDSVTQALFAMTLVSRSIELLVPRDQEAALSKLHDLRELQREALAEMRSLVFELQPGSIERDGLEVALRTHVTALEGRVGLPVLLDVELDERLPLDVETTLYRVAQEALHNVVRHASAAQARVRVTRDDGCAMLSVRDDGRGFDPAAVPEGHLGLEGMRARVDRLGGTLRIETGPTGTAILVEVPLAVRS